MGKEIVKDADLPHSFNTFGRVGAGAVWSGVGTLASPSVEESFGPGFQENLLKVSIG